jgi:hypothetical protein
MKTKNILTVIGLLVIFCKNIFAQVTTKEVVIQTINANPAVVIIAGVLLILWLLLVIGYLVWAIHKYNDNYGLSNHEWKILHPELYASDTERGKYVGLKNQMISAKQDMANSKAAVNETPEVITSPMNEPEDNPYKCDSFGLPPNTIRGIIALTALILFVLMEGINFFSDAKFEDNFKELTTALQMVIAFYFGSRAIEVLKARTEKADKKEEEEKKDNEAKPPEPEPKKDEPAKTASVSNETEEVPQSTPPPESPIIPEEKTSSRIISAIENEKMFAAPEEVLNKFTDEKSIQKRPLNERILSLTGAFETSESFPKCFAGLTNNFDGQGISFGVLQWNFGQGSLPPLLQKMNANHPDTCKKVFDFLYFDFERMLKLNKGEQLAWSKSIQYTQTTKNGKLYWCIDPKWIKAFKALGLTDEMISIQVDAASMIYQKALKLAAFYELTTERGAMLMFDIVTQNGVVDKDGAGKRIREDYLKIPASTSDEERQVEKMVIIANRRAEVSRPAYVEDVRKRKMLIATGEGKVHSRFYNLKDEFNITLNPIQAL